MTTLKRLFCTGLFLNFHVRNRLQLISNFGDGDGGKVDDKNHARNLETEQRRSEGSLNRALKFQAKTKSVVCNFWDLL